MGFDAVVVGLTWALSSSGYILAFPFCSRVKGMRLCSVLGNSIVLALLRRKPPSLALVSSFGGHG